MEATCSLRANGPSLFYPAASCRDAILPQWHLSASQSRTNCANRLAL
jgi:hypothetical protein